VTRDELLSAFVDDVPANRACQQALRQGAEFVIWDEGIPASHLEPIYRRRERHTRRTGQPTTGLREAVDRLRDCGTEPIRLGQVTAKDPAYTFILFLAMDQPHVIGCTGVGNPI
jgi:hypothetical protein